MFEPLLLLTTFSRVSIPPRHTFPKSVMEEFVAEPLNMYLQSTVSDETVIFGLNVLTV